jgi:hypothetical protein
MAVVAIDKTKGTRKVFTCSYELAGEIQAWRMAQRPIPSESAAVAILLWQALKRWRAEREDHAEEPRPRWRRPTEEE